MLLLASFYQSKLRISKRSFTSAIGMNSSSLHLLFISISVESLQNILLAVYVAASERKESNLKGRKSDLKVRKKFSKNPYKLILWEKNKNKNPSCLHLHL